MTVLRGVLTTWPGRMLAVALIAVLSGGAVLASRANAPAAKAEIRTQAVTRGNVTQSVAVSGSVAAMNQTKMSFKTAGKIAAIYVSVGQPVTAGQALAKLDTADLEAALAQAQANLVTAQNNYNRTASTSSDAQKALTQARQQAAQDLATAQNNLNKLVASYASAKSNFGSFTDSATGGIASFQDSLATIQSQIDNLIAEMSRIVGGGDTGDLRNALNAITSANTPALQNARTNSATLLAPAMSDYQSSKSALQSLISDFDSATGDTTSIASSFQLAQTNYTIAASRLTSALDTTSSVLGTVQTAVTTAQSSLNTQSTRSLHDPFDQWRADLATLYTLVGAQQQAVSTAKLKLTQAGTYLNTVNDAIGGSIATATLNVSTTAQRGQQSIDSAQQALSSKPYDLANSQASVDNAASAVDNAQANLDNATVVAPQSGVVASIASQVGETAANPFMVLANTTSLVLHGTIGESDVAKVKLGLVANVAVDAVTAARMTGRVTSLDPVATIQQGVPVYGIDVTIDVPNNQVKPGMTGTATVIIASKQGVLTVPNLAIRTTAGRRYLQLLKDGEAVDTDATFGLSNDTTTEVISGVAEGDLVVLPAARTTATARPGTGGGGFGGGPGVIVGR